MIKQEDIINYITKHPGSTESEIMEGAFGFVRKRGNDNKKYAGHSLRSGFATSTAEMGADERSIMAMTGHKTTQMVRRYIREANIFKNNALNKIKI